MIRNLGEEIQSALIYSQLDFAVALYSCTTLENCIVRFFASRQTRPKIKILKNEVEKVDNVILLHINITKTVLFALTKVPSKERNRRLVRNRLIWTKKLPQRSVRHHAAVK